MKKAQLFKEYETLLDKMGIHRLEGIGRNSNKAELENAIACMECPPELLDDYLTVIKLKYPNIYATIICVGNYQTHPFNRMYVYNTARLTLS